MLQASDVFPVALHQQYIAWGMRKNVTVVQLPDNFNVYKWIQID